MSWFECTDLSQSNTNVIVWSIIVIVNYTSCNSLFFYFHLNYDFNDLSYCQRLANCFENIWNTSNTKYLFEYSEHFLTLKFQIILHNLKYFIIWFVAIPSYIDHYMNSSNICFFFKRFHFYPYLNGKQMVFTSRKDAFLKSTIWFEFRTTEQFVWIP